MSKNANQHFIPRLLLKSFLTQTPRGSHLYEFRRGDQGVHEVGLKHAGSERYFYRDDVDPQNPSALDKILQQTESRIGPILEKIRSKLIVPSSGTTDYHTLIQFIHDLCIRTPAFRTQIQPAGIRLSTDAEIREWIRENPEEAELHLKQVEQRGPLEKAMTEFYRLGLDPAAAFSKQSETIMHHYAVKDGFKVARALLAKRTWRALAVPPTGPLFVIGDDPVVIHDAEGNVGEGIGNVSSLITIPLSPFVAIQGTFVTTGKLREMLTPQTVRKVNGVVVRNALVKVYGSHSDFEWQIRTGEVFSFQEWASGISEALRQ